MNPEQFPSSQEAEQDIEKVQHDLGHVVLFRVMHLDDHSGIVKQEGDRVTYVVDSQQYPDQGDHAYESFESAVDRAYPNYLEKVHAIKASPEDVVAVDSENSPGHVYIKNKAQVEAVRVPEELIDQHLSNVTSGNEDPNLTKKVSEKLFP